MWVRWGAVIAGLAIVAAAACGDDGGGGGITEPTDEPTEDLTTEEWIAEGDLICADAQEAVAEIEQPSTDPEDVNLTDRELEAWGTYLDALQEVNRDAIEQLDGLGLPSDDDGSAADIRDQLTELLDLTQEAADAAHEGDNLTFRTAITDITAGDEELEAAYAELGFQACGQGSTDDPSGETIPVEEWTSSVLAICEARTDELGTVPEPSVDADNVTEADLPEVAEYFTELSRIYSSSVDEIAAVGLPEGAEPDAEAFLDSERAVAAALDAVSAAAADGDLDVYNSEFDELVSITVDVESTGQDLGVEACAQ